MPRYTITGTVQCYDYVVDKAFAGQMFSTSGGWILSYMLHNSTWGTTLYQQAFVGELHSWVQLLAATQRHMGHSVSDTWDMTQSAETVCQALGMKHHTLDMRSITIAVWGPMYWNMLHSLAMCVYGNKTLTDQFAARLLNLSIIIPCAICSRHYMDHIPMTKVVQPILSTGDCITPIFDLHNRVSTVSYKSTPQMTHDTFLATYRLGVVPTDGCTEHSFRVDYDMPPDQGSDKQHVDKTRHVEGSIVSYAPYNVDIPDDIRKRDLRRLRKWITSQTCASSFNWCKAYALVWINDMLLRDDDTQPPVQWTVSAAAASSDDTDLWTGLRMVSLLCTGNRQMCNTLALFLLYLSPLMASSLIAAGGCADSRQQRHMLQIVLDSIVVPVEDTLDAVVPVYECLAAHLANVPNDVTTYCRQVGVRLTQRGHRILYGGDVSYHE